MHGRSIHARNATSRRTRLPFTASTTSRRVAPTHQTAITLSIDLPRPRLSSPRGSCTPPWPGYVVSHLTPLGVIWRFRASVSCTVPPFYHLASHKDAIYLLFASCAGRGMGSSSGVSAPDPSGHAPRSPTYSLRATPRTYCSSSCNQQASCFCIESSRVPFVLEIEPSIASTNVM